MMYRRDCFLLCTLILGPAPGFAAETAPAKRNEVVEAALGLARQLCDDLPSDAGALYSLGRVQQRFGDRKAAAASFQQGLDRNPSSGMGAALHRAAGEIAVQANDGRQAVRHFQAALRLTPEDATLYTRLAAGYTLLGDRRQALARYEQAVARRPDHALFQVLLARACRDAGQLERAKKHYERALALEPKQSQALYGLAMVVRKRGDRSRAAELLRAFRAEKAREKSAVLAAARGRSDMQVQCRDLVRSCREVADVYRQAGNGAAATKAEKRPALLADQLHQDRRSADALALCIVATEMMPKHAYTHLTLGALYSNLGKTEPAATSLGEALRLDPESADAYRLLAVLHLRAPGRPALALQAAERALRLEPSAQHFDLLSLALLANGDASKALEAMKQAIMIEPRNAEYQAHYKKVLQAAANP